MGFCSTRVSHFKKIEMSRLHLLFLDVIWNAEFNKRNRIARIEVFPSAAGKKKLNKNCGEMLTQPI